MNRAILKSKSQSFDIVSTVDRAALVLSAFRQSWDFLTLTDLVEHTGLSKPTVFRILSSLVAEGLVFQNEANNSYGLGFLNLRLADVFLSQQALRIKALPIMQSLLDILNENIILSVRLDDRTYDLEILESTQVIVPSQTCGLAVDLHESISGRAILAAFPKQERAAYFKQYKKDIARLPGGEKKLIQELRQIEKTGYISASGGVLLGGHTLAVAFAQGAASLSISFPLARFSNELEDKAAQLLLESIPKLNM